MKLHYAVGMGGAPRSAPKLSSPSTAPGGALMTELHTETLPLLPLTTGVVLPGMVVTLTIESRRPGGRRGRRTRRAPPGSPDRGAVRPRRDGRQDRRASAAIRGGAEAVVIRGLHRGDRGGRRARDRRGDLGADRAGRTTSPPTERAPSSSPASTARRSRTSSRREGSRRSRSSSAASPDPGQIADIGRLLARPVASSGRSRSSRRSTSRSAWRWCSPGRRTRSPRSR